MTTAELPFPGLKGVPTADGPQNRKEYTSDQEVRWCPGCGDYA
ncbi:MAG: 2-oxoacid:ferredoxin oxidoreductase subunit beta, partial [Marmoricola sp.]